MDAAFTKKVIDSMGENVEPRLKEVMPVLIRYLHDFAREVKLTREEWLKAVDFVRTLPQRPS